jgi:iron-sulfur cluster repair protein YtfE (RIC family)
VLSGLAELEADTRRHIHLENEILFPRARATEAALLTQANQTEAW